LIGPLTTREASLSSKIEGTQATMGEVLRFEAGDQSPELQKEKRGDINEVINYRKAIRHAEHKLATLPISQRVILSAHEILLQGVCGEGKAPGQFRSIPVWIGAHGTGMDSARFIPIAAHKIPEAVSQWERYLHGEAMDTLVQLAVLHAEFEAIHPFLDGNGRLGRILIPLILWQKNLIHQPMFYISEYLETNRDEYYERLLAISRDDDWTSWIRFFLIGLKHQAEANGQKVLRMIGLYDRLKPQLIEASHSQYAVLALDWVFSRLIFSGSDFASQPGIPAPTAKRLLSIMKELGILTPLVESGGRRSAIYAAVELLTMVDGSQ
jgi:Fic family protein